jgi:hypothetical protein
MAPSMALDRWQSSTMGSIAEKTILRDYLVECSLTPPNPFQRPVLTPGDWWDTGNVAHYKKNLLERHPEINPTTLNSIKKLKIPDISTWQGKYQRNKVVDASYPEKRNELYEIKPDSIWGIAKGFEKLYGIQDNFRQLGLSNKYYLGTWYPSPPGQKATGRKRVNFYQLPYIAESFTYRLRRMERSMRALGATLDIIDIAFEVERRYEGLLYYKLCIRMRLNFNGEEGVAKRVIRRLYEALNTAEIEEERLWEMAVAESYRVMDKTGKPVPQPTPDPDTQRMLKGLDTEEKFLVEKVTLVPELESSLRSLGQALFTKLRGLPGEQFAVCCDETYLENEIKMPEKIRLGKLLKHLQLRPPIPVQGSLALAGGINKPLSYMLAALYVVSKAADTPQELFHSADNFRAAQQWLERNPAVSLVVGGVVVYGTALVIAGTIATGGALFIAPTAASSAGLAPTGLAVEGGGAQLGYGLARSLAGESIAEASLPVIEEALPLAEQVSMRVTPEAMRRIASQELQAMAKRQIEAAVQSQLERAVTKAVSDEVRKEAMNKALVAGGSTLAAVALRVALSGAPVNTPGAAPIGPMRTIATEAGLLHLLKLYDNVDLSKLPQLYAEANYSRFSPETPGGLRLLSDPNTPKPKVFHLGVIRCL